MKTLNDLRMKPENSSVVVEVVVEIVTGSWEPECTISQAISQAIESATHQLQFLVAENGKGQIKILSAKSARVICCTKGY